MGAGTFGYWLGGFAISFMVGYALLRIASSPSRSHGLAVALRVSAVVLSVFFAYAGWVGSGRQELNLGSIIAAVAITTWALTIKRKTASPT
jgi:hypothetical protein